MKNIFKLIGLFALEAVARFSFTDFNDVLNVSIVKVKQIPGTITVSGVRITSE